MEYVEHKVRVHLDTYIAHPYWPEREKLINIQKESGLSRARTAQTRRKALDDYLASVAPTLPTELPVKLPGGQVLHVPTFTVRQHHLVTVMAYVNKRRLT